MLYTWAVVETVTDTVAYSVPKLITALKVLLYRSLGPMLQNFYDRKLKIFK